MHRGTDDGRSTGRYKKQVWAVTRAATHAGTGLYHKQTVNRPRTDQSDCSERYCEIHRRVVVEGVMWCCPKGKAAHLFNFNFIFSLSLFISLSQNNHTVLYTVLFSTLNPSELRPNQETFSLIFTHYCFPASAAALSPFSSSCKPASTMALLHSSISFPPFLLVDPYIAIKSLLIRHATSQEIP